MGVVAAFSQADAIGWLCFAVGLGALAAGVGIGVRTSLRQPAAAEEARARLDEARARIDEATRRIRTTAAAIAEPGLESPAATAGAEAAAEAAQESVAGAKSAVEQVGAVVAALPENVRFAGLLVLVGALLIGVATVQFGGVSLF